MKLLNKQALVLAAVALVACSKKDAVQTVKAPDNNKVTPTPTPTPTPRPAAKTYAYTMSMDSLAIQGEIERPEIVRIAAIIGDKVHATVTTEENSIVSDAAGKFSVSEISHSISLGQGLEKQKTFSMKLNLENQTNPIYFSRQAMNTAETEKSALDASYSEMSTQKNTLEDEMRALQLDQQLNNARMDVLKGELEQNAENARAKTMLEEATKTAESLEASISEKKTAADELGTNMEANRTQFDAAVEKITQLSASHTLISENNDAYNSLFPQYQDEMGARNAKDLERSEAMSNYEKLYGEAKEASHAWAIAKMRLDNIEEGATHLERAMEEVNALQTVAAEAEARASDAKSLWNGFNDTIEMMDMSIADLNDKLAALEPSHVRWNLIGEPTTINVKIEQSDLSDNNIQFSFSLNLRENVSLNGSFSINRSEVKKTKPSTTGSAPKTEGPDGEVAEDTPAEKEGQKGEETAEGQTEGPEGEATEDAPATESEVAKDAPATEGEVAEEAPAPAEGEVTEEAPAPAEGEVTEEAPAPAEGEVTEEAPAPAEGEVTEEAPAPAEGQVSEVDTTEDNQ